MVIAKLRHVLDTGEPATYEFESRESGESRYFENRAVLVRGRRVATGISISVTDITERKRLEQEILDVSSRERHTIGRDLHDGLGQELTGIALDAAQRRDALPASVSRGRREHQRDRRPREPIDRDAHARSRAASCRCAPTRAGCRSRCASSRAAAAICTASK